MAKRAPANPDKFDEASKWFRGRTPVTKAEWELMSKQARRQSFTIAGTQQLKVVQTVFDELQKAIDKGTPIEAWRKSLKKKLKGDFAEKNAHALKLAFVNSSQTAYNTGRYYQLSDPAVTALMPLWFFDAVLDDKTSVICLECAGTIRRFDDPWWLTHWCPLHHLCRSTVRALTEAMAKRKGGVTETLPRPVIKDDFGLAPPLRAGQVWEPERAKFDPTAFREYEKKLQNLKEKPVVVPSTRLGEVGEKVFGRKLTDAEIDALVGMQAKLPPGQSLEVFVKENARKESVTIGAAIVDANKNPVGRFSREYTRDGGALNVHNAAFHINEQFQNSGIGRSLFNAQVDAYVKYGVDKVSLEAAEVGKYVWTKAGFEWTNAEHLTEALGKFEKHLKDEVGAKAAKKVLKTVQTPQDISRVVIGEKRLGKEFLINLGEFSDGSSHIEMTQHPKKIKHL